MNNKTKQTMLEKIEEIDAYMGRCFENSEEIMPYILTAELNKLRSLLESERIAEESKTMDGEGCSIDAVNNRLSNVFNTTTNTKAIRDFEHHRANLMAIANYLKEYEPPHNTQEEGEG